MAPTPATSFSFTGIGTQWSIVTDEEPITEDVRRDILEHLRVFNEKFSRFVPKSEATAFRNAQAGEYPISKEFALLLARAKELRELTLGLYDPAVGELLELAGYDPEYRMLPRPETATFILPRWSLRGRTLLLDRAAVFDIGGMGKGYAIDQVAAILEKNGIRHYLVDGGGDMYATTKRDGTPWRVALEYPGKPDMAIGTVELKNEGLAVSDGFRRRWPGWHHIVHPHHKAPIEGIIGAVAVAKNAWDADSATSALFLTSHERYALVERAYGARYLVFEGGEKARRSAGWRGELFV